MSAALERARHALALASEETLVTVTHERSLLMRFARSRPTQSTAIDDASVEFAVLRGGHVGRATTNRGDDEALRACAQAAAEAAEAAATGRPAGPVERWPQPAPVATAAGGFDADGARLDASRGGEALAAAFEECAARGVEAHGVWTAGDVETAIASGSGAEASERVTDAFMKVTAIAPSGRSGYASATAVAPAALDAQALASAAAAKAAASAEPRRLGAGEHPVVLAPHAVGELLEWLGWTAFDGLAHVEGRGALSGRLGTRVAAPAINLSDSPRFARTLPRAFDAEGVPKAPLPLIQDGVAHAVVHDTRSAALAGTHSTGHALVAGGSEAGAIPTNLVLSGGGCDDEDELCAPIERGVYVTRLWYTNAVRPKETLITGVTRDGTFLIEDGRIGPPLADMRMSDSVLGVLERCEDLSRRSELVSGGEFYGRRHAAGVVCPALRSVMSFSA